MYLTFFSSDGEPVYLRPDRVDAIAARDGHPEDCQVLLSGGGSLAISGRNPINMAALLNELLMDEEDCWTEPAAEPEREPELFEMSPGDLLDAESLNVIIRRVNSLARR